MWRHWKGVATLKWVRPSGSECAAGKTLAVGGRGVADGKEGRKRQVL